ncbi:MAG: DUF4157 domain-containing protein [Bacteroidetes bacterium]|nr:DUF4157 domain-containing protein [Bacteroidota bacterium]
MKEHCGLLHMKVRIRENSPLAKLAAIKMKSQQLAMVLGHTIHLHNTTREEFLRDTAWVCHEVKHIQQYRQHGYAGFLCKYFFDWVKHGYYNNKFEKEARAAEACTAILQGVEFT